MKSIPHLIRSQGSLPFYCHPLKLFLAVWVAMVVSLEFRITDATYPSLGLPLALFAGSSLAFLFGYVLVRLAHVRNSKKISQPTRYQVDLVRLRRLMLVLSCIALILMAANVRAFGLPPLLGFFGFSTYSYTTYGKLKQLLFPLLMTVFVDSLLDVSPWRKVLYATFAFLAMLSYVARGAMMLMLFQALIVFTIRAKMSKTSLYLIGAAAAVFACLFVGILGSNRTSDDLLFLGLQIRSQAQTWPTTSVWIISYISVPISNLCWIVHLNTFHQPSLSFLYPLLPSFWAPIDPHVDVFNMSKIIDGVHTYLASYYLDFYYPGIFAINAWIGAVSGYITINRRISREFLTCSVFLASLGFIFFWDFFVYLPTVIQFFLQLYVQRYVIRFNHVSTA
jgi:oligosaccharide repeat unit polymerase